MKYKILLIVMVIMLCGCGKNSDLKETEKTTDDVNYTETVTKEGYTYKRTDEVTNYVEIVTNKDKTILIELYPDKAPITVNNFQNLVKKHYYDGTIFHRVIKDFMVQTGGFTSKGALEEVPSIKGEFASNGIINEIEHDTGVVSMARAQDKDSASNQFFICVNTKEYLNYLDGDYAAFGKVIAGYKDVLEISKVATDEYDVPLEEESIKTIRFIVLK